MGRIGEFERTVVVEPLEDPVPHRRKAPAAPAKEPIRTPEPTKEPVGVPA
jgi:hypothetical protein